MSGGYTPGPWSYDYALYKDSEATIKTPVGDVATVWVIWRDTGIGPFEEVEANARLIAAAPELVEALRRWMHTGCPNCSGDCGSANPPVMSCIRVETSRLLARSDGGDQ